MPDPPEPQTQEGALTTENLGPELDAPLADPLAFEPAAEAAPEPPASEPDEAAAFGVWLERQAAADPRLGPLVERFEIVHDLMARWAEEKAAGE